MWQLLVFTAFFMSSAQGASVFKRALDTKSNRYIDKGTVIGGQAGQAFSLLKIRSKYSPKAHIERVVLNLGDAEGQVLKGRLSFYQVNLEPENHRIVINLSQVARSAMNEDQINQVFKKSPFVKNVQMITDPLGDSTSLVLVLKKQVRAEIFQMTDKKSPGRLVLDLKK